MTNFPKLGAPAERALASAGYVRLEQLTKVTEAELSRLHGMGPNALGRLREALKAKGLSFAEAKTSDEVSKSRKLQ
jgi:phage-related tail protein